MTVSAERRTLTTPPALLARGATTVTLTALAVLRRVPFTLALLGTIWLLAVLTDSLGHGVPAAINARFGYAPADLESGQVYSILTSVLFIHKRFMIGPLNFSLLLFILPYEWIAGTRRVLAVFWGAHIIETLLSGVVILMLAADGFLPAMRLKVIDDVGMSAGTFACAGALLTVLPRRWAVSGAIALTAYLLAMLVLGHHMYDLDHVLVTPIGFAIAWLLGRRSGTACATDAARATIEEGAAISG